MLRGSSEPATSSMRLLKEVNERGYVFPGFSNRGWAGSSKLRIGIAGFWEGLVVLGFL